MKRACILAQYSLVRLAITIVSFSFLPLYLMSEGEARSAEQPIPLFEELTYSYHPVTTQNPKAQRFFDQGLIFIYAFNYDAAYRSFEQAAKLDPQMAMAYWGMALASAPIFSVEFSPEEEKRAYTAIQQGLQLASKVTEYERAYIEALAKRYSNDPHPDFRQLATNYKNAMQKVMQRYPDDLDAAALFAESSLDLNINHLWKENGEPNEGTLEIVKALESAIQADPQHIGANHYYIHTMEASKHPERALMSAKSFAHIAPILTHLVHTPSHIYLPVGDYQSSIQVNERAVAASRDYIQKFGLDESHPHGKLSHNLLYLVRSYAMAGRSKDAKRAAIELQELDMPNHPEDIDMVFTYSTLPFILIHFQDWHGIIEQPIPPSNRPLTALLWHFAKAVAYTSLDQAEMIQQERIAFQKGISNLKIKGQTAQLFDLLNNFLDAKIAESQSNYPLAIHFYQKATAIQETLDDDPLDWLLITRENLGGALLKNQQYKEAEVIFRRDLNQHRRNGRSLFGLLESLKGQSKTVDAFWIKKALESAWKDGDYPLNL